MPADTQEEEAGTSSEFEPAVPRPPPETCNDLDDDGDGLVDEGFSDLDGDGIADCADTGCEVVLLPASAAGQSSLCVADLAVPMEPWNVEVAWESEPDLFHGCEQTYVFDWNLDGFPDVMCGDMYDLFVINGMDGDLLEMHNLDPLDGDGVPFFTSAEMDGLPGWEYAMATTHGYVRVARADGTLLWSSEPDHDNYGSRNLEVTRLLGRIVHPRPPLVPEHQRRDEFVAPHRELEER